MPTPTTPYNPAVVEPRWRDVWYRTGIYEPDIQRAERPYFNLMMFPYPSAAGLHIGNLFAFVGADIHGRFMGMNGCDVFEPMGFDAFGIHSENYAIKQGIHPKILTARNVERFRETQLKVSGNRYDWSHEVDTTDPAYYRWTQWIFVQLFKAGLAERKRAAVNWCPSCMTVLANEQVIDGLCERCDTPVVQRELEQWFFKITNYADRLLDDLDRMDWSEVVKTAQRNWIGRSNNPDDGTVQYHLRDWLISRQRYWGPPIPIVYCDTCGTVPVPEDQLPVLLPQIEDFRPDDSGVSPLARHEEWYHTTCPRCGAKARRETDVSDTFLDSAWYFLRYPSSNRDDVPFDRALTKKWLPVHSYIGGNEHAVLHLLYSRFITMVLKDAGHIDFEEPFTRFRAHGLIVREGAKMSKSKGNVVNPDQYIDEWGADAFRTYLMFLGPFEEGGDFRDKGISGVKRFLDRLWKSVHDARRDGAPDVDVQRKLHQTIKKVGEDIARLSYNTAIAAMMEYMNTLRAGERTPHVDEVRALVQLASPFAPHITEELWSVLGETRSIFDSGWPDYDEALVAEDRVTMAVQVNGKTRGTISVSKTASQDEAVAAAMTEPNVAKFVTGEIRRVIFVPGRMLNLLV